MFNHRPGRLLVYAVCVAAPLLADTPATRPQSTARLRLAVLDTEDVQESSGVVASRINSGVLWTHNDSGAGPRVWAIGLDEAGVARGIARDLGYMELIGASSVDWEDISAGPGHTIYIFDGGDNPPPHRRDKRIHRFVEPRIDPRAGRISLRTPCESIRFEYPDPANPQLPAQTDAARYDAECLMVHPQTGDIYVVTKRDSHDHGVARVFKLASADIAWNSPRVHVLAFVADLTHVLGVQAGVVSTVTGGDISPDGRHMLIRRYGYAFEFTAPADRPFDAIFETMPTSMPLAGEVQGEGICYGQNGVIYTTSEVRKAGGVTLGPARCPVYIRTLPGATTTMPSPSAQ